MALPSNHRWIAVGKLALRNRKNAPHYAPEFVVQDLIDALADRIARNAIHRNYGKDSRLMWCADIADDDHFWPAAGSVDTGLGLHSSVLEGHWT